MKKIRKNITMFLVLAMVFQLVIPMAGNFAFGEEELVEESGFEEMGEDLEFGILSDGEDGIEKMVLDNVTLTFSKGGVEIPSDQDIPADADVEMEFVFSIDDLEGGVLLTLTKIIL